MDSTLNFQQHLLKQDYLNSLSKSLASVNTTSVPTNTSAASAAAGSTSMVSNSPTATSAVAAKVSPTVVSSVSTTQPSVATSNATTVTPTATSQPTTLTPSQTVTPVLKTNGFSYGFYAGLGLFLVLLGLGITVFIIYLVKNKKKKKLARALELKKANEIFELESLKGPPAKSENEEKKEEKEKTDDKTDDQFNDTNVLPKQEVSELFAKDSLPKDDYDDPSVRRDYDINNIFPSTSDVGEENTEEAMFAKQYTYENLHDSMFTRPKTKPMHKSHSPAWEANVQNIKEEIEKSGQTLQDYMQSSNAPISDDFVDAWKTSAIKTKPRDAFNLPVPKYAQKEMPALVSDSTQTIPLDGKTVAFTAMEEVLKARKRAKVLGVMLPAATIEQKHAVEKWSKNDEKSLSSLANSLKTMI